MKITFNIWSSEKQHDFNFLFFLFKGKYMYYSFNKKRRFLIRYNKWIDLGVGCEN